METGKEILIEGKWYRVGKMFSSAIIEVAGIEYQRWYLQDEKGKEYLDWIEVSKVQMWQPEPEKVKRVKSEFVKFSEKY